MSPLPDVIPQHCSDKWATSCSTPARNGAELRVRRGMAPMRFRLDSVGSSVGDSTASSPITSPTSPTPYSPMSFDLLPESYPPPDSALSTSSAFSYDFRPEDVLSSTLIASSASTSDATDASPSSADWRRVGRDLRGIADHFASSRLQNPQVITQLICINGRLGSWGRGRGGGGRKKTSSCVLLFYYITTKNVFM